LEQTTNRISYIYMLGVRARGIQKYMLMF
jgi:hypothetical protein